MCAAVVSLKELPLFANVAVRRPFDALIVGGGAPDGLSLVLGASSLGGAIGREFNVVLPSMTCAHRASFDSGDSRLLQLSTQAGIRSKKLCLVPSVRELQQHFSFGNYEITRNHAQDRGTGGLIRMEIALWRGTRGRRARQLKDSALSCPRLWYAMPGVPRTGGRLGEANSKVRYSMYSVRYMGIVLYIS